MAADDMAVIDSELDKTKDSHRRIRFMAGSSFYRIVNFNMSWKHMLLYES